MEDPLTLLTDFIKQKKPVYIDPSDKTQLLFGETKLPVNTEVNFKDKEGRNLKLGQVWFYLKNSDKKRSEYAIACKKEGFDAVEYQDQKKLLSALVPKEADFKPSLFEKGAAGGSSSSSSQKKKSRKERDGDSQEDEHSRKRQRTENDQDVHMEDKQDAEGVDQGTSKSSQPEADITSSASQQETLQNAKSNFQSFFSNFIKSLDNSEATTLPLTDVKPLLEADRTSLQKAKKREIPLVQKIISTKNKSKSVSFEYVLTLLNDVKKDEQQKKNAKPQAPVTAVDPRQKPQQKERFDENLVWKRHLGGTEHEDFKIDTTGSIGFGMELSSFGSSSDANAMPTITLPQIVQPPQPTPAPAATATSTSSNKEKTPSSGDKKQRKPIIIVPAALSSMLTLYNARDLLEKGRYVTTEEKKQQTPKLDKKILVRRTREDGKVEEYVVIDNPLKLAKEDWRRVVAIFTNGQTWQFKGWPIENPSELFNRYKGFHLCYDDAQLNEKVASWNVKVLRIGKFENKRHMDRTIVRDFWKSIS